MREDYFDTIEDVSPEDLIFIDETGTNQAMTPLYAKAPKGKRVHEARPDLALSFDVLRRA